MIPNVIIVTIAAVDTELEDTKKNNRQLAIIKYDST